MKVKIGYLTYEVREVPYIEVNGNEAANGEADYEEKHYYLLKKERYYYMRFFIVSV